MKTLYLPLLMILLLTATACEIAPAPMLSVNPDPLEISADGGRIIVSVNAVGEWTARPDFTIHGQYEPSFFYISTYKGTGNGEVPVTFEPNPYGFWTRNARIVFECVSGDEICTVILPVIQREAAPVFEFTDWNEPCIPADGGSFSATLLYNCRVAIDINATGVTYSDKLIGEDRFLGPAELTFTVPANPTSSERVIHMTLRPSGKDTPSKTYKLTQAGYL